MDVQWITVVTVLITSLATALPSLLALRHQRKKDRAGAARQQAETADKIIATSREQVAISLSLIEPLRERVVALSEGVAYAEGEVRELRKRNTDLEEICSQLFRGCGKLTYQIRCKGGVPVFKITSIKGYDLKPTHKS